MSLNGLDNVAIKEAHEAAVADQGGWFLLQYISRDEVTLHCRGTGGIDELRQAITDYEEPSPLYGFLKHRRKNVVLKYQPENCSRLLQVRAAVHFSAICERLAPYDTILEITEAKDLKDTKLYCSLHSQTVSNFSSSSSSQRRELGEISEREEEEEEEADEVEEERDEESESDRQQPKAHNPDDSERPVSPSLSQPAAVPDLQAQDPVRDTHFAPSTGPPDVPGVTRPVSRDQPSETSGRDLRQDTSSNLNNYSSHPNGKARVKLGPRPRASLDKDNRPQTAGVSRPVALLPAGFKLAPRKGRTTDKTNKQTTRNESQEALRLGTTSLSPSSLPANLPTRESGNILPPRPNTSSGASVKSIASVKSSSSSKQPFGQPGGKDKMTPERTRLMKAIKLREKKQRMMRVVLESPATNTTEPTPSTSVTEAQLERVPDRHHASVTLAAMHTAGRPRSDADDNLMASRSTPTDAHIEDTETDSHPASSPVVDSSEVADSTKASSLSGCAEETAHEAIACGHETDTKSQAKVEEGDDKGEGLDGVRDVSATWPAKEAMIAWSDEAKGVDEVQALGTGSEESIATRVPQAAEDYQTETNDETAAGDGSVAEQFRQIPDKTDCVEATTLRSISAADAESLSTRIAQVELPLDDEQAKVADATSASTCWHIPVSKYSAESTRTPVPTSPDSAPGVEEHTAVARSPVAIVASIDGASSSETKPGRLLSNPPSQSCDLTSDRALSRPTGPTSPTSPTYSPASGRRGVEPAPGRAQLKEDTLDSKVISQSNLRVGQGKGAICSTISNGIEPSSSQQPDLGDPFDDDALMDELQAATVQEALVVSKTPVAPSHPAPSSGAEAGLTVEKRVMASEGQMPTAQRSVSTPLRGPLLVPTDVLASSARCVSAGGAVLLHNITRQSSNSGSMTSKKSGVGSSISQRIKALEQLSGSTDGADNARPKSTFFNVRKTAGVRDGSHSPSLVERIGPLSCQNTGQTVATDSISVAVADELAETTRPRMASRSRSGSVASRLSIFEVPDSKLPRSRPESIQVTARIVRDPDQPFPKRPTAADYRTAELKDSPVIIDHLRAEHTPEPMLASVDFGGETIRDRRMSRETVNSHGQRKDGGDSRRPSLSIVKDFINPRRPSHPLSPAPSEEAAEEVVVRPSSVHQNNGSRVARRFSISSRRSSRSPERVSITTTPTVVSPSSGPSEGEVSPGEKRPSSRASRFLRRMSSSFGSNRHKTPQISPTPTVAEEDEAKATAVLSRTGSSSVTSLGDVNVQFPDTLLWKRRSMGVDSQGFLILSAPMGAAINKDKTNVKRFHMSDFRTPFIPDVEVQELPNSVVLDFVDGSGVQIACEDSRGQKKVLQALDEAHRKHSSFGQ